KQAALAIKKNIELLGVDSQVTLLQTDAILALERLVKPFDMIYVDPPYETRVEPIVKRIVASHLLKVGGNLFVEMRYDSKKAEPRIDFLTLHSTRKFGAAALYHY